MAGFVSADHSHHGMDEGGSYKFPQDKADEAGSWYLSRKDIEEKSPSKRDGIDLKKESYLRKSYCTFLQDLGMRLKVPQVTIATAIVFSHRFFLRQSHARNDRRTIATVCMFLAGKVEETPRPLKDVILVSYEIIHKKDPAAVQRIKQKEVYEQQKELILLGERLVLATLAFDFNVHHPYKPLVEAIKKFKVAQNALAQVAWNFVNDGLRTSLCLQFKPHHIAAGAIFLATKFLKVKLPQDGERVWWQEFDVTPRQLEEVSNQMLELYEQNRVPPSQGSEVEGSTGVGPSQQAPSKAPNATEETTTNCHSLAGGTVPKPETSKASSSRSASDLSYADNHGGIPRTSESQSNEHGNSEMKNTLDKADSKIQENRQSKPPQSLYHQEDKGDSHNLLFGSEGLAEENQERNFGKNETRAAGKSNEIQPGRNLEHKEGTVGQSPIKKFDKDKVKAALEKRRKLRGGDTARKTDYMDEDDLIERELEDGIEMAADGEKMRRERRQGWPKHSNRPEDDNSQYGKRQGEEGELSALDDPSRVPSGNRKRKAESLPDRDKPLKVKQHHENMNRSNHQNYHDHGEDRTRLSRLDHSERDHKRHLQENHV